MSDIRKVLDSIELPEELQQTIIEAWNSEVEKNREEVRAEFKSQINEGMSGELQTLVEAADALITSTLNTEIEELREDRRTIKEMADAERAKSVKQRVNESREAKRQAALLDNLISEALKHEIKEFHEDRKRFEEKETQVLEELMSMTNETLLAEMKEFQADRTHLQESLTKLENLTVNQLTRELSEFQEDRRNLQEQKVRMEADYKRKLEESKDAFIKRAERTISETVDAEIHRHITTHKEDIRIAKENTFGRKIFETFAATYLTSHLSEGTELHKLRKQLSESEKNMQKMQQIIKENEQKINKSKAALREANEAKRRGDMLNKLLRPLNNTQRETMSELLEGVAVDKLEDSFNRYVPSVLDAPERKRQPRRVISEDNKRPKKEQQLSESTGKRDVRSYTLATKDSESTELEDILRAAGIKKS